MLNIRIQIRTNLNACKRIRTVFIPASTDWCSESVGAEHLLLGAERPLQCTRTENKGRHGRGSAHDEQTRTGGEKQGLLTAGSASALVTQKDQANGRKIKERKQGADVAAWPIVKSHSESAPTAPKQ